MRALLTEGPVALWVGYGARAAAEGIRELGGTARRCGHVLAAREGRFPEDHPLFVGVTGMGGHDAVSRT